MTAVYSNENRREYTRVDAYLPLGLRLVPAEEQGRVKSRISGEVMLADFNQLPPLDNHPQRDRITVLNTKMDQIIRSLLHRSEGFHTLPFKYVTLSGSGMSFSSHQLFSPGDLLEIKTLLTLQKPAALYLYGEVLKVQKQTSGYFTALCFRHMDEGIRDRIIRFAFETEREMLRERRANE